MDIDYLRSIEGYEYLKHKRLEKGYSLDDFSTITGIKVRSLTGYECSEKSLDRLVVNRVLALFDPLNIDIEWFYEWFYGYKGDVILGKSAWEDEHPRDLDYRSIRTKSYDRIAHLWARKTISKEQYEYLMILYKTFIKEVSKSRGKRKVLTGDEYERYYLGFICDVKSYLYINDDISDNLRLLLSSLFKSEYASSSFSGILSRSFCEIIEYSSVNKLRNILSGKADLGELNIIVALKMCYILGLSFSDIFGCLKKTNQNFDF